MSMSATPQISDAEWEVMKVLWQQSPLTAGEVVEALSRSTHWRPRTIKTLLSRLVRKGAVRMSSEGRKHVYRPRVSQQACIRHESRSFLSRVFSGQAAPAIVHLLTHAKLSEQEIEQLKQVLDDGGKHA
jgi:BlaI family transcriptional regulator, penicillinase repressor